MTIREILAAYQAPVHPAPTFVSGNSVSFSTSSSSLSASGAQAGDYAIAVIASTAPNIQTPAGFTLLASGSYVVDSYPVYGIVVGRRLASTDSSMIVIQGGTASATLQVFRGVHAVTASDVVPTWAGHASVPNSPEIAPVTANTMLVSLGALFGSHNEMTLPPSGFSNPNWSYKATTTTEHILSCSASKVQLATGPVDPDSWSGGFVVSPSISRCVSFSVALRPA